MIALRMLPAALLLLGAFPAWADQQEAAVRKEVMELERQWEAAVLSGDVDVFERVLAEDFTHTSYSGETRDRKQWLDNHKPGHSPYTALNTQDLRVKLYGDVAVISGKIRPQGTTSAGQQITGEYRFLRVWAKRNGHWQLVAFQSTRISERKE